MTSDYELKDSLFNRVENITLSNAKFPENILDNPTLGEPYIRYFDQPITKKQAAYGTDGRNYYSGIFHIEVCCPSDVGPMVAIGIADKITPSFKRGTVLTLTNGYVTFYKCQIMRSYTENALYILPIYAYYYAYMIND